MSWKHWWKSAHLGCWYMLSTYMLLSSDFPHRHVNECGWPSSKESLKDGYGSKVPRGRRNPQRERKHICNSERKPQELVGDGRFSKYWCFGFSWLWVSRKIHTIIYFRSLSLSVPNPRSGPEHQNIHSVGDPPVEAQGKRKAPHATARAALFLPTVLHGASTALGGLAARHARAGTV